MGRRSLVVLVFMAGAWCVPGQPPPLPPDTLDPELATAPWPKGLGLAPEGWDSVPPARIALGRRLFFDPILSVDRTVACATCHDPRHGFSSPDALPLGVLGRRAERHPPSLFNRVLSDIQSWDGRAPTLEAQVVLPISNPVEMDLALDEALERLAGDAAYRDLFDRTYADGVTAATLAQSLGAFVGRLTFGDTAVDRFQAARARSALNREERAGLWIYESKGRCWQCHSGPNFTDERFHNTGVGSSAGVILAGRAGVTGDPEDQGRFRTPSLRGVAHSPPYMHDGSLATLEDVVAFYRRGGNPNPRLDPLMGPLDLSDDDAGHLVAFLRALSRRDP